MLAFYGALLGDFYCLFGIFVGLPFLNIDGRRDRHQLSFWISPMGDRDGWKIGLSMRWKCVLRTHFQNRRKILERITLRRIVMAVPQRS